MPRPLIERASAGPTLRHVDPCGLFGPADAPHIVSSASDNDRASQWQYVGAA